MALVKTSSSDTSRYCRYHVFLSFRGKDTRKKFIGHLYTALVNAGYRTFCDDDELERGEDINPELQKAIKQSRTSVIVFSKNYTSSRWCLDELVMILEQKKMTSGDHVVLPVFYDIDPSHVRKLTGRLAKAFATHHKTQSLKKVKKWREALAEVADLGGMVLQNQANGYESKFIRKIVDVIKEKLRRTPLSVAPNMIGMHSRVERINRWLRDGSADVDILVIYGMGGIGKTTISKSVYNSNFGRFEASSFLENIRDISLQPNGLVQIQRQLLSDILKGEKVMIHSVSEGATKIEDAIGWKKVLLVLDDVDHMDQIYAVLRMKDRFHPGSKIIITTRHKKLSKAHQVTMVHQVEMLDYKESLELFSWHAFGQDKPTEGYMGYSEKIVRQTGGLPLALQVLGSSLSGESICVWKSRLEKLEAIPHDEIMKKLRISYDLLQDDHDRSLFLHIACFFIGKEKNYIVRILDGCHFFTIVGIQNLIDRCLVTLDEYDKVNIHDMLREMGRGIVRQESEDPGKRSRLWHNKDSFRVLREKNGTQTIEGLVLQMHPKSPTNESVVETNAFERMHKLILLHLSHVQLEGCCAEFPVGLRWLCWLKFPLDFVPTDFRLESLIVLEMQHSNLRRVFKGSKCLPSLKILDLSYSHGLADTANFSFCPNLEKLILVDCTSLVDAHESIGDLKRLVYFNMNDCRNLRTLPPNMVMLESLETVILSCCSSLDELSIMMMRNMESLKVLKIDGIPISELWPRGSAFVLSSLPCSLVDLSLSGCNLSDDAFPIDLGNLSSLRRLYLDSNPISRLPNCIKGLKRLERLSFRKCTMLRSLVELPQVDCLYIHDCISLEKITYQRYSPVPTYSRKNLNLGKWEPYFKLESIDRVDVEIIDLLSLCNLGSLTPFRMITLFACSVDPQYKWSPVKGQYEGGIFSTMFAGNEVPMGFSHTSRGSPISFIVPLFLNRRILGVNVFLVYANSENICIDAKFKHQLEGPINTTVSNKSKGLKWIYGPKFQGIVGKGEDMIWLSHWKMENVFEEGNEVVVSVMTLPGFRVMEFGVQLVHEEEEHNVMTTTQPNTMDPCYPYVIGGHLGQYEPDLYQFYIKIGQKVDPIWLNNFDEDYYFGSILNEDSDDDDAEKEELQKDDSAITTIKGSKSNNWFHTSWKVLITATGLFLTLSLIARSSLSQRKNRQSSSSPPLGSFYTTQSSCGRSLASQSIYILE